MLNRFFKSLLISTYTLLCLAQGQQVAVTTRTVKGAALTTAEMDANFNTLQYAANGAAQTWGRKDTTTTGLTWGYYGGSYWTGSAWSFANDGTVALTASATNYVERTTTGTVSVNTSAFTATKYPMAKVITGTASITSWSDYRFPLPGGTAANPMSALGDTIYGGTAGAETTLAGNTTSTKKFLAQTGTGSVSAAPAWSTIVGADISSALTTDLVSPPPIGSTTPSTGAFTTLSATGDTAITSSTVSSSTSSGALQVTGGVGIQGALNIGGSGAFFPTFGSSANIWGWKVRNSANNDFMIFGNTDSTYSGAITWAGSNSDIIYVPSSATHFRIGVGTSTSTAYTEHTISGFSVNMATASTSSTTGALTVPNGGLGVSGAIFGGSTIQASTTVTAGTTLIAGSGATMGTTAATVSGASGQLVLGRLNANPSSTTDNFVGWRDTSFTLTSMATGSLVLYARNSGTAGISFLTGNTERGKWQSTGELNITNATDSTSTGSGSLFTAGGIGVALQSYFGDQIHMAASTTTRASTTIPVGTAPTSPAVGDLWHDSTQKAVVSYTHGGIKAALQGVIFTETADKSFTNTAAETSMVGTGTGTVTLPANFWTVGKTVRITGMGYIADTGTPTFTFKTKIGSVVTFNSGAITMPTLTGNQFLYFKLTSTCRTTGASGTVFTTVEAYCNNGATAVQSFNGTVNTATATVDTTASAALDVTGTWGTGSSSNTVTTNNLTVEVLN